MSILSRHLNVVNKKLEEGHSCVSGKLQALFLRLYYWYLTSLQGRMTNLPGTQSILESQHNGSVAPIKK